jgi:tRNA pseudouridine55 synthase
LFGILNINKPSGVTSRDVVNKIGQVYRKATGEKLKAGHAGTLDPLATGVLVVCLGRATKLMSFIQSRPKRYVAEFQLDASSVSDDTETEIELVQPPVAPSLERIAAAIPSFTGEILQKPPAYSAISINGQRAYKLARQGVEFEIAEKNVTIHDLAIVAYDYPILKLNIECGSGTYIRSLGRDLAHAVGTKAVMTSLVRTEIGPFKVDEGLNWDSFSIENFREKLHSATAAVDFLPKRIVTDDEIELLKHGQFVKNDNSNHDQFAAVNCRNELIAILEPAYGSLKPAINFVAGQG